MDPDRNPPADTVTAEQITALTEAIQQIQGRLDNQSGILESLRRGKKKEGDQDPPGKPDGYEERVKALEERAAQLDANERKLSRRQTVGQIARALKGQGVNEIQAEDLAEVLVTRDPDKFKRDDATGQVVVQEKIDSDPLSVKSWAHVFVASDRGRVYLGTKANPTVGDDLRRGGNPKPGAKVVTSDDIAKGNFDPDADVSDMNLGTED